MPQSDFEPYLAAADAMVKVLADDPRYSARFGEHSSIDFTAAGQPAPDLCFMGHGLPYAPLQRNVGRDRVSLMSGLYAEDGDAQDGLAVFVEPTGSGQMEVHVFTARNGLEFGQAVVSSPDEMRTFVETQVTESLDAAPATPSAGLGMRLG